jgi:branched-chain amino acid transport system permease protein
MPKPGRGTLISGAIFVFFAALIAWLPSVLPSYRLDTATRVGIYFIAILSLNLVLGYAGQISLGQGALMLVGAYTTGILNARHGWTIIETLPVAFLISFVIGALLGLPALRLTGIYLALVTFAFAFAMPQLPLKFDTFFGGANGLGFRPESEKWVYNTTWVLAGIMFIGVWLVVRGRTGRAFRAIRDSEVAATSAGVSLPVYKVLAFALSGGIAGVAGSMLAAVNNSFISTGAFTVFLSLTILIGAAVAGFGSLWGMLIGALFIGALPDVSSSVPIIGSEHGLDIVYALVVIIVIFLMPNGFAGLLRQILMRATRSQRQAASAPPSAPAAAPPRPPAPASPSAPGAA